MTMIDSPSRLPDPFARPEFYAGVPAKRLFAWIVDSILIFLVSSVAAVFSIVGLFFVPFVFLLVGFLYRWVTISWWSATPGMRLMSIEFRTDDGEQFAADTAFLHTLGYTISFAIFPLQLISIALMLISARGQGLTDHLLGTTAIHRTL